MHVLSSANGIGTSARTFRNPSEKRILAASIDSYCTTLLFLLSTLWNWADDYWSVCNSHRLLSSQKSNTIFGHFPTFTALFSIFSLLHQRISLSRQQSLYSFVAANNIAIWLFFYCSTTKTTSLEKNTLSLSVIRDSWIFLLWYSQRLGILDLYWICCNRNHLFSAAVSALEKELLQK